MNKIKKRIMVGGVFDIIHVGHIRFLWAAKKVYEPSELIVIIARDSTVEKVKGRPPVFSEEERLEIVSNLKPVDKAILGYEITDSDSFFRIIYEYKPDIIVLGYDQFFNEEEILAKARLKRMNIRIVRLPKFNFNGLCSSTDVRRRVFMLLNDKNRAQSF